jgi:hypothetical protein
MLSGSEVYEEYLSNYYLKNWMAKKKSPGGKLKFGVILNVFHRDGITWSLINGSPSFW